MSSIGSHSKYKNCKTLCQRKEKTTWKIAESGALRKIAFSDGNFSLFNNTRSGPPSEPRYLPPKDFKRCIGTVGRQSIQHGHSNNTRHHPMTTEKCSNFAKFNFWLHFITTATIFTWSKPGGVFSIPKYLPENTTVCQSLSWMECNFPSSHSCRVRCFHRQTHPCEGCQGWICWTMTLFSQNVIRCRHSHKFSNKNN